MDITIDIFPDTANGFVITPTLDLIANFIEIMLESKEKTVVEIEFISGEDEMRQMSLHGIDPYFYLALYSNSLQEPNKTLCSVAINDEFTTYALDIDVYDKIEELVKRNSIPDIPSINGDYTELITGFDFSLALFEKNIIEVSDKFVVSFKSYEENMGDMVEIFDIKTGKSEAYNDFNNIQALEKSNSKDWDYIVYDDDGITYCTLDNSKKELIEIKNTKSDLPTYITLSNKLFDADIDTGLTAYTSNDGIVFKTSNGTEQTILENSDLTPELLEKDISPEIGAGYPLPYYIAPEILANAY